MSHDVYMEKLSFSFEPAKSCRVCLSDASYHVFEAMPKDEKLPEDVNTYFKIVVSSRPSPSSAT